MRNTHTRAMAEPDRKDGGRTNTCTVLPFKGDLKAACRASIARTLLQASFSSVACLPSSQWLPCVCFPPRSISIAVSR